MIDFRKRGLIRKMYLVSIARHIPSVYNITRTSLIILKQDYYVRIAIQKGILIFTIWFETILNMICDYLSKISFLYFVKVASPLFLIVLYHCYQ